MNRVIRKKKYKSDIPENTITKIKDIINSKLKLSLKEDFYQDDNYFFHSCRISIEDGGLGEFSIGTNGKGITHHYSLASAYGEFMERIQNNVLIPFIGIAKPRFINEIKYRFPEFAKSLIDRNLVLKYDHSPDEKYYHLKHLKSKYKSIIPESEFKRDPLLAHVPFYNVSKKQIEYLPLIYIDNICTSNGMCAGNTPKEAIIQGVCEVIERYAIRLIYNNNLTPPSIHKDLFKDNVIHNYITELENNNNWHIEIKDCSCGIGLPVVGILIVDKKNIKYHFHVGADPSPITALERSLTELYQGRKNIEFHDFDFDFLYKCINDEEKARNEREKTYRSNTGRLPLSVLQQTYSYEINGFDESYGLSDDTDLIMLTELIAKLGFELFVRDVSYLGFPAFRVFIPGMSEIFHVKTAESLHKWPPLFLIAHNLNKATESEIEDLIEHIKIRKGDLLDIKFLNSSDVIQKDHNLTLAILHIKIKKYSDAYNYLNKFIDSQPVENSLWYKCLRDFIFSRFMTSNLDCTFLNTLYDIDLLKDIEEALEQGTILKLFDTSSCFDCNKCKIRNTCKILNVLEIGKRLEEIYETNIPNQEDISKYFNDNKS